MKPMKIAIIHDWLVFDGGAEKVLKEIISIFPNADIFTMVNFPNNGKDIILSNRPPITSFIQNLPFSKSHYRSYLPLMPIAVEQFDLSEYDLVISSSYAVAKGVITGPRQIHVSYVHSPARYAWDLQAQYLKESRMERGLKSIFARWFLHKFRIWDARTVAGVDFWIANSRFIARRIRKIYGVDSTVINPPIDLNDFSIGREKENFYLTASRMVPYKRIPLIVEAFTRMPDKRLIVIGDGPEMPKVKAAAGPNVTVLGYQSRDTLIDYMRRARAFVFAAEEDFGIIPLEAQACGTPVVAFGKGGALETVIEGETGLFFFEQTAEAICSTVQQFEESGVSATPGAFEKHVSSFSSESFRTKFRNAIEIAISRTGEIKEHTS